MYKSRTHEAHYQAIMFPMKVTEELAQWPEMHQRQRAWVHLHGCRQLIDFGSSDETDNLSSIFKVSIAEAKERCHHWWMKEALDTMVKMISISTIRNDSILEHLERNNDP